jgi:hypothetical protein
VLFLKSIRPLAPPLLHALARTDTRIAGGRAAGSGVRELLDHTTARATCGQGDAQASLETASMTPQETFVTRLRRHRERNRISLDEIAAETRVKKELFEALEANDLSSWPRGLYARAWVRTYACAVGLDPIDTVDEFCRLFPNGDRRGHATMQDIAAIVASGGEFKDEFPHPERRQSTLRGQAAAAPRRPSWHHSVLDAAKSASDAVFGLARHVRVRTRAGAKPT